jgi:hypothetical protein
MSIEIKNSLRSASIIRVVGPATETVSLANLSSNVSIETINSASIKRMMWSTNGSITITRNGELISQVYDSGEMRFSDYGHSVANNSTSPIVISVLSGGTIFLEVTKDATYNPALEGI